MQSARVSFPTIQDHLPRGLSRLKKRFEGLKM